MCIREFCLGLVVEIVGRNALLSDRVGRGTALGERYFR